MLLYDKDSLTDEFCKCVLLRCFRRVGTNGTQLWFIHIAGGSTYQLLTRSTVVGWVDGWMGTDENYRVIMIWYDLFTCWHLSFRKSITVLYQIFSSFFLHKIRKWKFETSYSRDGIKIRTYIKIFANIMCTPHPILTKKIFCLNDYFISMSSNYWSILSTKQGSISTFSILTLPVHVKFAHSAVTCRQ